MSEPKVRWQIDELGLTGGYLPGKDDCRDYIIKYLPGKGVYKLFKWDRLYEQFVWHRLGEFKYIKSAKAYAEKLEANK